MEKFIIDMREKAGSSGRFQSEHSNTKAMYIRKEGEGKQERSCRPRGSAWAKRLAW